MSFNPNENPKIGKLPNLPGLPNSNNPQSGNGLPPLPGGVSKQASGVPKQSQTQPANGLPGLPNFPPVARPEPQQQPVSPAVPSFAQPQPRFTQPQPQPVEQQQQYYAPTPQPQPEQYYQPEQTFEQPQTGHSLRGQYSQQVEDQDDEPKKGRRNSKPNKNSSKKSLKSKDSTKPKTPYSGKRRNVIYARVAVFGLAGILMIAGVFSFLPKTSGLTASDKPLIISAVRENLNYTDFPRASGEGFAEAFTSVYLNYNPNDTKTRTALLTNFVDPNVMKNIDSRPATAEEVTTANTNTPSGATNSGQSTGVDIPAPSTTQTVTDGPYVVGSLMYKGGNAAMFTVMSEVNNSNWVFIQVPMYYNKDTGGLSVSGSITFAPPISSTSVPAWEGSGSSWDESDQEVKKLVESDIAEYAKAWTASDDTNIQRFLVKEDGKVTATRNATEGLESRVKFIGISNFEVQAKEPLKEDSTAEDKADFYTRQASLTISFLEPSSNLVYSQQYRLVLEYVNQDWFVKDINNVSTLTDRDATAKAQANAQNKTNG